MAKDEGYYGPMLDDYEKRIELLEGALHSLVVLDGGQYRCRFGLNEDVSAYVRHILEN